MKVTKGADASSNNVFIMSYYNNSYFCYWTCMLRTVSCNFRSSMSCFVTKVDIKTQALPLLKRNSLNALDEYRKLGLLQYPT